MYHIGDCKSTVKSIRTKAIPRTPWWVTIARWCHCAWAAAGRRNDSFIDAVGCHDDVEDLPGPVASNLISLCCLPIKDDLHAVCICRLYMFSSRRSEFFLGERTVKNISQLTTSRELKLACVHGPLRISIVGFAGNRLPYSRRAKTFSQIDE